MIGKEIYCDECRQDLLVNKGVITRNNCYAVLGGIWIDKSSREEFKTKIKELKDKYKVYGEIKWKKVSNSQIDFYKELIGIFFEFKDIAFRAIVIDARVFDISKYHNGSGELGFYKCYYQLLKEWLNSSINYYVFLDYKKDNSRKRAYDLKKCLNNHIKVEAVKNLQFINSKESIILQVEDVIMGAVGYKFNYGYEGKSKAKNELLKEIEKYESVRETLSQKKKFNIFKIKLKDGNKNE